MTGAAPFEAAVEAEETARRLPQRRAACQRHRLRAALPDLDEVQVMPVLTPGAAMRSQWEPEEGLGREVVPSGVRGRAACCVENLRQDR